MGRKRAAENQGDHLRVQALLENNRALAVCNTTLKEEATQLRKKVNMLKRQILNDRTAASAKMSTEASTQTISCDPLTPATLNIAASPAHSFPSPVPFAVLRSMLTFMISFS